ncbi:MAG TPA: YfaZ family outer membrane protein [Steroidobacteraceae bacterium]|nr:YfaZ family outer membrane protein [Steroidobacteraceae bacterium]
MYVRVAIAAVVLSSFALSAHAQGRTAAADDSQRGELALSNETMQVRYVGRSDQVGENGQINAAFFLSEERDIVLSGGVLFPAALPDNLTVGQRLTLRFGPQVYAALLQEENNDVLAMSVGVEARFVVNRRMGLAVSGQAFYAPDILTFGSADNLTDLSARVEMQVAPDLLAFGGVRWFEFDLTEGGGTTKLQDELFFGVGYRF